MTARVIARKGPAEGTPKRPSGSSVEELLKSLLVLSRTIDVVLETRATEAALHETLAPSKVRLLQLLGNGGGRTATQLAHFLGVTKPAITQLVDSMARSRLVRRRTGEHDSREVILNLTDRGASAFRSIRRKRQLLIRVALRAAGSQNVGAWIANLRAMTVALAQADQAYRHFCLQCGAHADGTCVLVGGNAQCQFLQHACKGPRPVRKRPTRARR